VDGQVLEEGITEAGSAASFQAAATSYATHGYPTIPFYIFYSMFGFQRTGDQVWAFGDSRARGFLLGATAGRTTLNGEGLQHEDGHSHLHASTVPNVLAYDPAFAYEVATIVRDGIKRMYEDGEDVFYYLTLYNENYPMPALEGDGRTAEDVNGGILRGLYPFRAAQNGGRHKAVLLGSGSIMQQVLRAQELLADKFDIAADVWSATSYQQLRNDALAIDRWNRLHPTERPKRSYVVEQLDTTKGPIVAASDYLKAVPHMIAPWVDRPFVSLGTDGFGRSDTREALRRFFEVDAEHIAAATLYGLARAEAMAPKAVAKAIADLGLDPDAPEPRIS
jgi:pyruvate dehydrogenase E1 component